MEGKKNEKGKRPSIAKKEIKCLEKIKPFPEKLLYKKYLRYGHGVWDDFLHPKVNNLIK